MLKRIGFGILPLLLIALLVPPFTVTIASEKENLNTKLESPTDVKTEDTGPTDTSITQTVDWWPMFRHDLSHTGYSTSTAPNTNQTLWKYTTTGSVRSSPAVADGKVYVGSVDNKVYAFGRSLVHDVAVANVTLSKTVIGQNFTGTFWVTVENQGDFSEVFNVSAFYDGSAVPVPQQWPTLSQLGSFWSLGDVNKDGYIDNFDICLIVAAFGTSDPDCDLNGDGVVDIFDAMICAENYDLDIWTHLGLSQTVRNETIVNVPNGGSLSVAFRWNTTGVVKGNYTISATADTVLGETDTLDNNFIDGWIIVAMIGDITGPDGWPDGKVEMRDVGTIARRFDEQCNEPLYHINYDITGVTTGMPDGKIDMRDIGLVCSHFGETDP